MDIDLRLPKLLKEIEKRAHYRGKSIEERNALKARHLALSGVQVPVCPIQHSEIGWGGPPNYFEDIYVCRGCFAAVGRAELRDRGTDYELVRWWDLQKMMDEKLKQKFILGDPKTFAISRK